MICACGANAALRADTNILPLHLTIYLLHQEQNGLDDRKWGTGNGERGKSGMGEEWRSGMVLNSGEPQDCSALGGRQAWQVKWQCFRVPRRRAFVSAGAARTEGLRGARRLSRRPGRRRRTNGRHGVHRGLRANRRRAPRNRAQRAIRRADGFVVRAEGANHSVSQLSNPRKAPWLCKGLCKGGIAPENML